MDGFSALLDCITDDRGLFCLSVCNKAVVPRWLYASCWWRHGMVLRTRIFTLGNAPLRSACRTLGLFASSSNTRAAYCEKDVQQIGVYQNSDRHHAVGPRAFHQIQLDQHPGETESDDPCIKAHAYPTKRLGIQPLDEIGAKRNSNRNGGNEHQEEALAFGDKQAKLVIHDGGHARLSHANQCETGPKLIFDQALIVEQNR